MSSASLLAEGIYIYQISEGAVSINFGDAISQELMHKITLFNQIIRRQPFPGLITTIPAYTTVTILFDPIIMAGADMPGFTALEKINQYLFTLPRGKSLSSQRSPPAVTIPVCYGGEFGPDLAIVADLNGLTPQQVIDAHRSVTYLVHMIGFLPGFAYLGGMPLNIAAPRKKSPRGSVPTGSVGIAGLQTGVYPLQTPGGWQIIGRTPLKMFDINRLQPSLLTAGDTVIFMPVTLAKFNEYR